MHKRENIRKYRKIWVPGLIRLRGGDSGPKTVVGGNGTNDVEVGKQRGKEQKGID